MGKKKVYDSETGEVLEVGEGGKEPAKVSVELLKSFRDAYSPCESEMLSDEVFTMGRLREYFGCFISVDPRWGDLLPSYLEKLDGYGYKMRTSYMGEPAIFVTFNHRRPFDFCNEEEV